MIVDGDPQGLEYIQDVSGRGFSAEEMARRSFSLPAGDMEAQLVASGLQPELKAILNDLGVAGAGELSDPDLTTALRSHKTSYAALLGRRCAENAPLAQRMPEPIRNAIGNLRGLA